jgi:hypothetical protein
MRTSILGSLISVLSFLIAQALPHYNRLLVQELAICHWPCVLDGTTKIVLLFHLFMHLTEELLHFLFLHWIITENTAVARSRKVNGDMFTWIWAFQTNDFTNYVMKYHSVFHRNISSTAKNREMISLLNLCIISGVLTTPLFWRKTSHCLFLRRNGCSCDNIVLTFVECHVAFL